MDRAAAYVLARFATQPQRYGRPRPITPSELTSFRLLAALAFTTLSQSSRSVSSPSTSRAGSSAPEFRRPFAYAETWNKLDLMMNTYEDQDLQDLALSNIPIDTLYSTADALQASNTPLPCYEDALAEALVKWFKPTFFEWIDPIKCPTCGKGTKLKEVTGARTEEERQGGAGRVEVHVCEDEACGGVDIFPRFNDLRALMKSRRGRCGEFANMFTLMIRAVGLRARYVWNAEDHVWNEYYSPAQKRWIHMDSCENARDQPHLYSTGWGKKMSYCVAFSVDGGAVDVSRTYIPSAKWDTEAVGMRGRAGNEEDGIKVLKGIRERRRMGVPEDVRKRLDEEDERDRTWWKEHEADLAAAKEKEGKGEDSVASSETTAATVTGTDEALLPRQSGTKEWTESRGEAGSSEGASKSA